MRRVVVRLLEFKWRILAVSTALVVASSIATFGYLSFKELPTQQSREQWHLAHWGPSLGKAFRVEIPSVDESAGTALLKVDVLVRRTASALPEPPDPLSFGPLMVSSLTMAEQPNSIDFAAPDGWPWLNVGVYGLNKFSRFSDSRPQTVESVVLISGEAWWYPFDRYVLAAGLNCEVILRDDKQKETFSPLLQRNVGHELENEGYYLSTQVPQNLIIERATKEDLNRALHERTSKPFDPDLSTPGLVVLMLHRPIFPRFFAVFFGVVAVIWIWIIGMIAEKKQLTLNVVGYFLSIWAIRAPLAIGAPRVTTLMDYVTLGLYAILVAVVGFRLLCGFQKPSTS